MLDPSTNSVHPLFGRLMLSRLRPQCLGDDKPMSTFPLGWRNTGARFTPPFQYGVMTE
jgi:hypothetical protein